uniref:Uncharacterized protein n=1 Tax=Callorhinchus milii TaxID=7868 RepID=A0A4W3I0C9_CALMI
MSLACEASAGTPELSNDDCVYYVPVSLFSSLEVNNLTADCTEDLASALSTNRSLKELHLGANNLRDSGVKRLCEALRNPECMIQSLGYVTDSHSLYTGRDLPNSNNPVEQRWTTSCPGPHRTSLPVGHPCCRGLGADTNRQSLVGRVYVGVTAGV